MERVETKCTAQYTYTYIYIHTHIYIEDTRDAEGSQAGRRRTGREEGMKGGAAEGGGKKREREGAEGEILTLEMRELPRVCGVRNFLAI